MFKFLAFFLFALSAQAGDLQFGIDRIGEPQFASLFQGKRLALLSHRASVNREGRHAIDLFHGPYRVMKLFVPEHGLRSELDDWVGHGTDPLSGLPVISLYQRESRAPRDEDLLDVDAIVIDLQDVGMRYYTYSSTVGHVLKKAAEKNIEVILLDRANPIGGWLVEGFMLDPSVAGHFVAYHTIATRHGMTLGELALMYNSELSIGARLTVIPVANWSRTTTAIDWNRDWVPPSPALMRADQAILYSLWGALESANLAVGRGTDNSEAFRRIGAPWITTVASEGLARELNSLGYAGLRFSPVEWRVTRATHNGRIVRGVKVEIVDFTALPPTDEFLVSVTQALKRRFPNDITFNNTTHLSYGSQAVLDAILGLTPYSELRSRNETGLQEFYTRRRSYLLN